MQREFARAGRLIPRGWQHATVGDVVAEIQPGFPSGEHNQDGVGTPHLRPMNVDRLGRLDTSSLKFVVGRADRIVRRGEVLFNNTNSAELVGKTAAIDRDIAWGFSNHMTRLEPNLAIASTFLAAQLHYRWMIGDMQRRCVNHVNQASIASRALEQVPLVVPPRAEQERIMAVLETQLSRIDAAEEALERVQQELVRYRASLRKAACEGRLVPSEAALARAEARSFEPASEFLSRVAVARRSQSERARKRAEPTALNAASLPTLPEGWVWTTVRALSVAPPRNGLSIQGSDHSPGVPALRLDALTSRGLNFAAIRYLPVAWQDVEDLRVRSGDFFVSRGNGSRARVGSACVAPSPPCAMIYPDTMIRLRLHPDVQPWLRELWAAPAFRAQIEAAARTTAGIWKISQGDIEDFLVPLPPLAEQNRIVAEVERRLSVSDQIATAVDTALGQGVRLRQALLKRAFEGKLVPQDPKDEPANVLLARVRSEREALATQRRASFRRPKQVKTSRP